jgi:DNA-binding transcriptional MerR regulator|tara:strand:+ start:7119 stop:8018 length:900 start_codon:yes stop_codon:yes gene_type:complete
MNIEQNYRIGLTTQITGIRPETLRAWERRYEVVKPIRTEAGDRLYTQADIDRLLLIKKLVDNGDAISAVANLNYENLEKRISSCKSAITSSGKNDLNFILLGKTILDKKSLDSMRLNMIDVVQDVRNIKSNYHCKIDFIIAEVQTVNQGTFKNLQKILKQSKATKLLCAYDFGKESDIAKLTSQDTGTTSLPLNHSEITSWCSSNFPNYLQSTSTDRLLTDQDITNIVAAGSTINCECPRHLGDLISKLTAFEKYSSECEVRNTKDAEIHKELETTSAKARYLLEEVLIKLAKVEGIKY